jgi:hypothetical protein
VPAGRRALLWPALLLFLCLPGRADCPPGDFNGDCRVDFADLLLLAEQWLAPAGMPFDVNENGRVDAVDLASFGKQWRQKTCPIVINEVLAHAHADASDWIELHNISNVPVAIGGWFLSDEKNDLKKYGIAPGTVVGPHGYLTFFEATHFANPFDPGVRKTFAFSENGETACLYSNDDEVFPGCLVEQPFGASETGMSFGRYRRSDGTYEFVTLSGQTPGAANAYPLVGPVVINEIMYHPAVDGDAEYIELLNIGEGPVTLFDAVAGEPWRLLADTGLDFWFPRDEPVTLPAGEYLLLVRDLKAMRAYKVPADAKVFDWGSGKLANQGEELRLLKPGDVDTDGIRYWIVVDRVRYSDGAHGDKLPKGLDPWPPEADGLGPSLNRMWPARYGNDPNNWQATIASPGTVND